MRQRRARRNRVARQPFVDRAVYGAGTLVSRPGNPSGTAPAHAPVVRWRDVNLSQALRNERILVVKELDIQNLGTKGAEAARAELPAREHGEAGA